LDEFLKQRTYVRVYDFLMRKTTTKKDGAMICIFWMKMIITKGKACPLKLWMKQQFTNRRT
jgi:hypothetical protein